jgi:glycosyltransferase involved in cell wall biosynthesis
MYKVKMAPCIEDFDTEESGIKRVVEAYTKYLPEFGFEVLPKKATEFDVSVTHAGSFVGADVCMLHGLYWTADYHAASWEWHVNKNVIDSMKHAKEVTVPSAWVQEVIQRDMRFSPTIIPHGIDADEWRHDKPNAGYVLWNKNRDADVCSPEPMAILAHKFQDINFVSTFAPKGAPSNIKVTGLMPHDKMKDSIQRAGVYLSTTKETFGIGVLEAMAAGIPVLGFKYGGNVDLIRHGVTGYLAKPGNYDDLAAGLSYCMQHRSTLGVNAMEIVKEYTWKNACEIVADVLSRAMVDKEPSVGVVVPAFNKETHLERAVESVIAQERKIDKIVIVNDGSSDNTKQIADTLAEKYPIVQAVHQDNSGVAVARNRGAQECGDVKYISFLDADDRMEPEFIDVCVNALEEDRSLHVAYTRLKWVMPDGTQGESKWPDEWNFDDQLRRKNQIPTCNVIRKSTFDRLGGYKSKYCPTGAGSEDAELWTRFGVYGYKGKLVDTRYLFEYSFKSGHTAQEGYSETDWLIYHPWAHDGKHPFASCASTGRMPSHPVRQYDQPVVSVIIPVGNDHKRFVRDALDSVEGQSYRSWEIIIVWDNDDNTDDIETTYPYVKIVRPDKSGVGAGAARNAGAREARGEFLLFLDADDWLYPNAIENILGAWEKKQEIVYTDYVGKATVEEEYAASLGERLLHYKEDTGEAVIMFNALDFDCKKAIKEPRDISRPYIWNLITSLVPKVWHDEIGGFDEVMPSWEDWDYWIRMAKSGKCFTRLPEPLVVYRFYTGSRRDAGMKHAENLVKYLLEKYKDTNMSGCGCSGKSSPSSTQVLQRGAQSANQLPDSDFVLAKYMSDNKGQHLVVGHGTGRRYGYRAGGEIFYVSRVDIDTASHLFAPVDRKPSVSEESSPEDLSPPSNISTMPVASPELIKSDDLSMVPGVTPAIEKAMNAAGITSRDDIVRFGEDRLVKEINGIGDKRAQAMLAYINMEKS